MKKIVLMFFSLLLIIPTNLGFAEERNTCVELTMSEKKELLTTIALKYEIPPEILKTIALIETKMTQCEGDQPLVSNDGGIGMMQITETDIEVNEEKLKYDAAYNIEIAAQILKNKWNMQQNGRIPKINNANPMILENWYFTIMAYNGLSRKNDPFQPTNLTYQERFFTELDKYNNIKTTNKPPAFPVEYTDVIMEFPQKQLYWSKATSLSSQMLQPGDYAFVYNENGVDYGNLREQPSVSSAVLQELPFYEEVQIIGGPYVEASNEFNYFVMYEVKGHGFSGYIASSNLRPMKYVTGNHSFVANNKVWTIPLKEEVNKESISTDTIFIVNEEGKKIPAQLSYNEDDLTIQVKPINSLQSGETYTLYIDKLQSSLGEPMEFPVGLAFTVKTDKGHGSKDISVIINGGAQEYRQPPFIENGRTLVPLRGIFETLGATVIWDNKNKTVTAVKGTTEIFLPIGSMQPTVNGAVVGIETAAKIVNGSTMVPLRFISESLGAKVVWDSTTRSVYITYESQSSSNTIDSNIIKQPF